jgi:hypothetical protein
MLPGSGYIPILKRAMEQSPEAYRSRTLRTDDLGDCRDGRLLRHYALHWHRCDVGLTPVRHQHP